MRINTHIKTFSKRATFCFFVILFLFLSCVLRVAVIASGKYAPMQSDQTTYKINVARLRGTIYDCNMIPLTNSRTKIVAAVSPTPMAITAISRALEGEALESVLDTLKNNKPAVCIVPQDISCYGIATTKIYDRYTSSFNACHLIGYTDDTGHGVTGLELAYDDLLFSDKYVCANFASNGKGDVLRGVEPYFENDISKVLNGVVTTIDINIQNITENAVANLNSGCAIVAEVENGKIRAMASVPTFDVNNISQSLQNQNLPMINRALYAFDVGSVFKPCVAATAIENNLGNLIFKCEGSLDIGDRNFRCHNLSGHGEMDLCDSLAQSCNCFFYNCAISLGGDAIYKTASALSFGNKIKIADNFFTIAGNMPNKNTLSSMGTLANLSIGQGALMTSPIAMLNLYLAIAGDGSYYVPSVVEKTIKDGVENLYDIGKPTRVMQSKTASILREYLKTVITDGTGGEAATNLTSAAGKTGTAQTGRYYNDKTEITNSWFCGFFPAEAPKYVIIVMSDSKLNISTASVFAKITDAIAEYKGINGKNND